MSTSITTIFNNLQDLVQASLPEHRKLWNSYDLDLNPEQYLRKGFGIRINAGTNTDRCIQPQYWLNRNFSIVITREALAKDSDPLLLEEKELQLLEDLHLVINDSVNDLTLGNAAFKFVYVSDNGRQEIFIEDKPYFYLEATFDVEYEQTVS